MIIPVLRSGGYIAVKEGPSDGDAVKAKDDFVGYERSYYSVKPREGQGIRMDFVKAEVWEKGKFHSRSRTLLPLFESAAAASHVRLVYLTRASQADHNMAIVAASDAVTLNTMTKAVTSQAVCQSVSGGVCVWVPAGVAVTPEEKFVVDGKSDWGLAR